MLCGEAASFLHARCIACLYTYAGCCHAMPCCRAGMMTMLAQTGRSVSICYLILAPSFSCVLQYMIAVVILLQACLSNTPQGLKSATESIPGSIRSNPLFDISAVRIGSQLDFDSVNVGPVSSSTLEPFTTSPGPALPSADGRDRLKMPRRSTAHCLHEALLACP